MVYTPQGPQRIVCLTEETTETIYLLGEQRRIVGISGFTVRPPQARHEKPRVSAFTSAKIDKILDLKPDLVFGFSDLQADICQALVKAGLNVHIFNHRSVIGIFDMIATVGAIVQATDRSTALIQQFNQGLAQISALAQTFKRKPRVYFEEWHEPPISCIQWVSELIEIAGGEDCFKELSTESLGKNRIIADPTEVVRRNPDIILGSWCGRKFNPDHVRSRVGWQEINAVKNNHLYEIKSPIILQPGPAALTDGIKAMQTCMALWNNSN